jgi:DNA-binding NarL/FixJ family response regulator
LKAGADGYVAMDCALEELVAAVQRVLAGGRYVSSTLAREMALDLSTRGERPLHEGVSNRELEVLRLIGSGKTATQIAAALALSVKTVSYHRSHLLAKLNLKTTAELIRFAIDNDLVE